MKRSNKTIFSRNKLFKSKFLKIIFFCVLVFIPLLFTGPGYLSVDEGTYHLMAKNLADGYGFEIWNGLAV